MWSKLSIFTFKVNFYFVVCKKISDCSQSHENISLFSIRSITVLHFTFRFIIQLCLILVYTCRYGVQSHFLHNTCNLVPLLRIASFLHCITVIIWQIQLLYMYGSFSAVFSVPMVRSSIPEPMLFYLKFYFKILWINLICLIVILSRKVETPFIHSHIIWCYKLNTVA